ncbi:carbonic anhydrase 3-like isoform X2 [Epargyreus clarus]|uniref:carbonic anhydrase 3-like isoform X2 n=1 Tax=Epargyreus clarus TaxID=520877 RepID=UPI003C2BCD7F
MVRIVKRWLLLLILTTLFTSNNSGVTQDQTSSRPNTLFDDADDIQKQLDNEARDRIKFGKTKTIWVFHLPTQFPEFSTGALSRNPGAKPRCAILKPRHKSKLISDQSKWPASYPDCGGGSQSPIDLPTRGLIKARAGRPLVFSNYDSMPKSLTLRDDGKRLILFGTWKRNERPLVYGGAAHSRRYLFHSLILHWPSEHFVGGFQYPMESQVIHISAEYSSLSEAIEASARDPLAILGIANLYKFGNHTQSCISEVLKASTDTGVGDRSIPLRPLSAFSPPFKQYVTYQGSLTVPPCTESVLWMVRARSLTMTRITGALTRSLLAPGGEQRWTLLRQPHARNDRKIFFFN